MGACVKAATGVVNKKGRQQGKVEPGEPLPVTACREVEEEGGAVITLGKRLAPARYKVNGNPKQGAGL